MPPRRGKSLHSSFPMLLHKFLDLASYSSCATDLSGQLNPCSILPSVAGEAEH